MSTPAQRSRLLRLFGRVALNVALVAMLACAAIMLVPAALGFHRYVILTGSMTGTYDRGSIVFDRPMPVSGLRVGDPITYSPPPGFTSQGRVTHRIWSIRRGVDGSRVFRTKGDANKHPDVWTFTLNQPMQDQVVFHIPEVGYLFLLLSLREFRIVLVGLPSLLIGIFLLRQLWREGGDAARRQHLAEQGWQRLPNAVSRAVLAPCLVPATDRVLPRLDLCLRPVPIPATSVPSQPGASMRPRLYPSRPLRVGRLPLATVDQLHRGGVESSAEHGQLASGASIATARLVVPRIPHERRARVIVPA